MSAHESNKVLRYGGVAGGFVIFLFLVAGIKSCSHSDEKTSSTNATKSSVVKNIASGDSEAESLDTLTADLNATKKQIEQVVKDNNALKQSNALLQTQLGKSIKTEPDKPSDQESKDKVSLDKAFSQYHIGAGNSNPGSTTNVSGTNIPIPGSGQPLTTITDLTVSGSALSKTSSFEARNAEHVGLNNGSNSSSSNSSNQEKPKPVPFYTIPANATAIHDRLMTALVGRIPVKSVVTDPYPFKIVFSDDTLAANGLRVPHLKQMVVSGFTEGDLNLKTVRGWVTSLTFVFEDGTISSVTSNDNNIGKFTKENALGYLTDQYGNPIQGELISNAPSYLATKVGLGVASGFATAYSQNQVNNQTNAFGGSSSTVTGSPFKFMLGQGAASGANQAQSWFDDRAENSFDAIYVPTVDKDGKAVEIAVNFAKEVSIDYNPTGRKVSYDHAEITNHLNADLD